MNFINKRTRKQNVLNFVLTLGRRWMAKKDPKFSSEYFEFLRKIPSIKKISTEPFNICEAEISLEKS